MLESEKCPVCGASVKKENLKSHYQKVHPRRASSLIQPKTVTVAKSASVFAKHTLRNIVVVSLIVLAVSGVSVFAYQFANANTLRMHWHATLTITSTSSGRIQVPAQIGIIAALWKDHSLDQYGVGGLAPLHTHDTTGTIHVEANTLRNFTLDEFLAIWGESNSVINGHTVNSLAVDGVTQNSPTLDVVFKCEGSTCSSQQITMTTT